MIKRAEEFSRYNENFKLAGLEVENLKEAKQSKTATLQDLEIQIRGTLQRLDTEKTLIHQEMLNSRMNDYESEKRKSFNYQLFKLESEVLIKNQEFQTHYREVRQRFMNEEVHISSQYNQFIKQI